MKAVLLKDFGGADQLYIGELPDLECGEEEILVKVKATALNRADLLQRKGGYPPPQGASEILGLEMAGEVIAVGGKVSSWKSGDRVFALLPGGGYAEQAVIPAQMAMPIPENLSFEQAAAIPEVFLTAYINLMWLGGLQSGQRVLVHAGASGVGTAALQIIREMGATSYVTAGTEAKLKRCLELGAASGWNYKQGSFAPWIAEHTAEQGVDLILDFVGAPYFSDNISSLAVDGKLIVIGLMGGAKVQNLNLSELLARRLQIIGTTLRSRSLHDKIKLTQQFSEFALPRFRDGRLKPVIDSVFSLEEAARAHEYMEQNKNIGKIVLQID